jgi:hypothetical protein
MNLVKVVGKTACKLGASWQKAGGRSRCYTVASGFMTYPQKHWQVLASKFTVLYRLGIFY